MKAVFRCKPGYHHQHTESVHLRNQKRQKLRILLGHQDRKPRPNDLLVSKVITQPARKAEYVLVWEREHRLSPLMEAFVDYVRDFLQEDMIHSQRFRAREEEYALPGNTVSL